MGASGVRCEVTRPPPAALSSTPWDWLGGKTEAGWSPATRGQQRAGQGPSLASSPTQPLDPRGLCALQAASALILALEAM